MGDFFRRLRELLTSSGQAHPLTQSSDVNWTDKSAFDLPDPITQRVLIITHNPIVRSRGNRRLHDVFGWNDSAVLAAKYIEDVRQASYGYANYVIIEHIVVDDYPVKLDGFRYDEQSHLRAWESRKLHEPNLVDYLALVHEFKLIERINANEIDEVWLFGFPYGGYYESIMCGAGAFWCNAPALKGTEHAKRKFVIMGFNYERGVGEMLEDLGHRTESIMSKVYEGYRGERNLWERFIRYDKTHPGKSECGNVHFAPNSLRDYDWGNPRSVLSRCDTWYRFPDLRGNPRSVNAQEWGGGDIRQHHLWWFRHIPHVRGQTDGVSNNWWEYVINPNRV